MQICCGVCSDIGSIFSDRFLRCPAQYTFHVLFELFKGINIMAHVRIVGLHISRGVIVSILPVRFLRFPWGSWQCHTSASASRRWRWIWFSHLIAFAHLCCCLLFLGHLRRLVYPSQQRVFASVAPALRTGVVARLWLLGNLSKLNPFHQGGRLFARLFLLPRHPRSLARGPGPPQASAAFLKILKSRSSCSQNLTSLSRLPCGALGRCPEQHSRRSENLFSLRLIDISKLQ
jgi:hypothetical protein